MRRGSVAITSIVVFMIVSGISDLEGGSGGTSQVGNGRSFVAINLDELESHAYDAGRVKVILGSEDTKGISAVMELTELPGYKTAWHRHNDMDEAYYVLEGVWTAKIEDKVAEYPAGAFVFIPRGTAHGQGNFSKSPVRLLLTITPGGFEGFFRDRVELFRTVRPGDQDFQKRFAALRQKHQAFVEILGTWEP